MTARLGKLGRVVTHALRHESERYGLVLDREGWVPVASLLAGLAQRDPAWAALTRDDLVLMIEQMVKKRHELDGDRIRARYGHSLPGLIEKPDGRPPAQLFHGTSPRAWQAIRAEGLRSMGRQYVHLSEDSDEARRTRRRKGPEPILLEVDTVAAAGSGTRFALGNDTIWLADHVAPEHLSPSGG